MNDIKFLRLYKWGGLDVVDIYKHINSIPLCIRSVSIFSQPWVIMLISCLPFHPFLYFRRVIDVKKVYLRVFSLKHAFVGDINIHVVTYKINPRC